MTLNAKIAQSVQELELGAYVVLYELDLTAQGGGMLRFHSMMAAEITFKGQVYSPWPIEATGFERTTQQQSMPTLTVANIDGSISALCQIFNDMLGVTLTRRQTFAKYLDGMPAADVAAEFKPEVWIVERKAGESTENVSFELSSVLDFGGQVLPARPMVPQCPFEYRGEGCAYVGPPVAKADDTPTTDPALDRCGKRLSSCKLRQWPDGVLNHGGVPAVGLIKL